MLSTKTKIICPKCKKGRLRLPCSKHCFAKTHVGSCNKCMVLFTVNDTKGFAGFRCESLRDVEASIPANSIN